MGFILAGLVAFRQANRYDVPPGIYRNYSTDNIWVEETIDGQLIVTYILISEDLT